MRVFNQYPSHASRKISWQVTGIRHDAYAIAHRIEIEQDKPPSERGAYLHPDAFQGVTTPSNARAISSANKRRTR